jgi:glycosyltransferase XagB
VYDLFPLNSDAPASEEVCQIGQISRAHSTHAALPLKHSARLGLTAPQWWTIAGTAALSSAALLYAPLELWLGVQLWLSLAFAMLISVRILALWHVWGTCTMRAPVSLMMPSVGGTSPCQDGLIDRANAEGLQRRTSEPPVYSVLVALFRESPVVAQLVSALGGLDYPSAKLDILLIIESCDDETRDALAALTLARHMRVIVVPDGVPRTKPRALNYGLTFARGDYVVVFDAEDQPEPDQIHKALAAFQTGPPNLGCVQAALNIYNPSLSWLTSQFTLEYTALFDAILPALARVNLPVPLGGTSNHFKRQALDHVGAWDAYNVTEDADLGLRLARQGWRVGVLASTTWEEAPPTLKTWMAQRTRWLKGWMQTYAVHMRQPITLWRELGPLSFVWVQIVFGGGILSALLHPWFYVGLLWGWLAGHPVGTGNGLAAWVWGISLFSRP